ncbi:DUF6443 domain-containing protein [Kordia jejudonensis]|uniref:DUF6443 domain-containing protein n=1 Tax=Kordia jejudonensis TaxID=1348245 RepID=UPI0006295D87|nr:DUF6443 domain-containing protein [Kordia jejudonensis]
MKKLLITLTAMFVSIIVMAQTNSKNYVKNTSYQQPVQNETEIQALPILEKVENITYYDGLGRPEQSIALRAGGTSTKYVNELPNEWQEGLTTTPYYIKYGSTSENIITSGVTPFGNTDLLWKSTNQDDTDVTDSSARQDGGWTGALISVDKNRTYRYTTWVKKTGNLTNGTTYFGTRYVSDLSGNAQSNPYFWYGFLPELDVWYQIKGVVHPHDYTGADTGESGVYDINGNKVLDGTEFKWNPDTTVSRFRNYLVYCTDLTVEQYWYKPHLEHSDSDTVIEDIVTPIVYDADGRKTKEYLPYADETLAKFTRENIAISRVNNYYSNTYSEDFNGTLNPYSEKNLEASPLARILEQGAPGTDWKVDASADTDHTIKFEYETNAVDEVAYYTVTFAGGNTEAPQLQYNGAYAEEQLYKNITKDENWNPTQTHLKDHTTEEFKNKSGQLLLKRNYDQDQEHDTFYIYDDFGNLTYVLSPKASEAIKVANYVIAQNILDELCYQYKYDGRNRLVEKKIPGKGWGYIIYDTLDRPVLMQDANQRNKSPKQWLFTKYDHFGRVAYTGLYTNNSTRTAVQNTIDTQNVVSETRTVGITIIGDADAYYSNTTFPNTDIQVLTVNYFDDYPKEIDAVIPNPINFTLAGTTHTISNFTRTLATGSKVRILDSNQWIISATYYDDKKRPIYAGSHNAYLYTLDIVKTALDFSGKVLETESLHTKGNNVAIKINDFFTYDHASRLLTQTQSINNGITELIVNNSYDALGQLVNKKVGGSVASEAEASTGLQSVDYKYNVRGWLKQINDVENLEDDLFSFELSYNTTKTATNPLYNGNISETLSRTANDAATTRRGYGYTYDALNRLKGAKGIVHIFGTLFASHVHYNEGGIQYDKNGNILRLNRKKTTNDYIDFLFYNYDIGNKLVSVDDNSGGPEVLEGFKDGNTIGDDYTYDANGNMLKDLNKGIGTTATDGIKYNHLNLPTQIVFDNDPNKSIYYLYDATGVKQSKVVADNGNYTVTYYAGNFIYESNSAGEELKFFNHSEGYAQPNNTGRFDYVYQFKDHLGNIRVSYSDTNNDNTVDVTEIVEENNYYPFGLKHKGYNTNIGALGDHKYGFGGKEEQSELGLEWMDITARNYDPAIGRWMNLDPLAEKMRRHSPYNFGFNNPVYFQDYDGMAPASPDWEKDKNGNWVAKAGDSAWTLSQDANISAEQANNVVESQLGKNYKRESDGMLMSDVEVGDVVSLPESSSEPFSLTGSDNPNGENPVANEAWLETLEMSKFEFNHPEVTETLNNEIDSVSKEITRSHNLADTKKAVRDLDNKWLKFDGEGSIGRNAGFALSISRNVNDSVNSVFVRSNLKAKKDSLIRRRIRIANSDINKIK